MWRPEGHQLTWRVTEHDRSTLWYFDLDRGETGVLLADVADNAGGGAPSDSTFVLRRVLERGIGSVASGLYWDPVAVRLCREAGVGARFELEDSR